MTHSLKVFIVMIMLFKDISILCDTLIKFLFTPGGHRYRMMYRLTYLPYLFLESPCNLVTAGGVLFGYDVGVISGAKVQVAHEMELSCGQEEALVNIYIHISHQSFTFKMNTQLMPYCTVSSIHGKIS